MRWRERALHVLNLPLSRLGLTVLPTWQVQWWTAAQGFAFAGRQFACYYHGYNCGWPPYASERCVELALADAWLRAGGTCDLVEVGAVTPYYWPGRVGRVVDPFDPHPGVTDRESLFDVNFRGRRVLSVSTFEHVGTGDYGIMEEPGLAVEAFRKVFEESEQFLLTVPAGYNPRVDDFVFQRSEIPDDVAVGFLVRDGRCGWREEAGAGKARLPYGDPALRRRFPGTSIGEWANAVIVIERGGVLTAPPGGARPGRDANAAISRGVR